MRPCVWSGEREYKRVFASFGMKFTEMKRRWKCWRYFWYNFRKLRADGNVIEAAAYVLWMSSKVSPSHWKWPKIKSRTWLLVRWQQHQMLLMETKLSFAWNEDIPMCRDHLKWKSCIASNLLFRLVSLPRSLLLFFSSLIFISHLSVVQIATTYVADSLPSMRSFHFPQLQAAPALQNHASQCHQSENCRL